MEIKEILIGVVCLALGLSFAYKSVLAVFLGRSSYWAGFLPVGIISPFLIHLPAGHDSLVKTIQGWWIHIILGPLFLLCSILLLASGADRLGLPGTATANFMLTFGRRDVPPAIVFSRQHGYQFPIAKRIQDALVKVMTQPVLKDQQESTKMVPGN